MQRPLHPRLAATILLLLFGLLAACGGDDTSSGSGGGSSSHNDADVTFATDMVPHHAQAIEMAKMAVAQAGSQDVVDLANQIKDAQQPEIETMAGWLEEWGEPTPEPGMAGMDSNHMDSGDMTPMMTTEEMRRLSAASGQEFDRLWLTMMTEHHQGAIDMAETELQDGQNTEVKALAQRILDAQQAEIETMNGLL